MEPFEQRLLSESTSVPWEPWGEGGWQGSGAPWSSLLGGGVGVGDERIRLALPPKTI